MECYYNNMILTVLLNNGGYKAPSDYPYMPFYKELPVIFRRPFFPQYPSLMRAVKY